MINSVKAFLIGKQKAVKIIEMKKLSIHCETNLEQEMAEAQKTADVQDCMFLMNEKDVTMAEINKAIQDDIKAKERQEKLAAKKKLRGSPRPIDGSNNRNKSNVKPIANKKKVGDKKININQGKNLDNEKELHKEKKESQTVTIDNKIIDLGDIEIVDLNKI